MTREPRHRAMCRPIPARAFRALLLALVAWTGTAGADLLPFAPHNSRLLATGGATAFEGQAGGGIVPWAVLSGYGSSDEIGASAFYTHVELADYALNAFGVAVAYGNRLEVSYARNDFNLGTLGAAIGKPDKSLRQDVYGAKLRLAGDLVYGALPQLAFGVQYKRNLDFAIPAAVGARHRDDVDFYLAASKLWLAALFDRNVFADITLRGTRANQAGILGFGGDRGDDRELTVEGALGIFLTRHIAVGAEYRQMPDKLRFSPQSDWLDAFVGVFPDRNVSVVAAYADLGTIATLPHQRGWYVSLQIAF